MATVIANASASITPPSSQVHQWQDDPLFLHYGENLGAVLVSQSLVGGENYLA